VIPPLSSWQEWREDIGFRNRTSAAVDLDDMIGVVLDGLDALGPAVVCERERERESESTLLADLLVNTTRLQANNTWVIFTSDNGKCCTWRGAICNSLLFLRLGVIEYPSTPAPYSPGYHLGEHTLFLGKSHPYSTDVDLPLYIRGPGLPAGTTLPHPTNHLDITATLVDLAGSCERGVRCNMRLARTLYQT
jgi:hypothetical protein